MVLEKHMGDKLLNTKKILLVAFLISTVFYFFIKFVGYTNLYILLILISIYFIFIAKGDINKIIFSILLFLILFDNPNFYFTDLNLRLWYPIVLITSFIYIISSLSAKININHLLIFSLLLFGLIYAIFDGVNGLAYYFKYLIFILMIYVFIKVSNKLTSVYILNSMLLATTFIAMFGFIQIYHNVSGDFSYTYYPDFRPHGFFSETTWYSEFIVFGLFLSIVLSKYQKSFIILSVIFLSAIFISMTRNAIIGMVLGIFIYFLVTIIKNKKINRNAIMIFSIITVITFIVLQKFEYLDYMLYKFSMADKSAQGRLEGFYQSLLLIKDHFFIGIGFLQSFQIEISGSTIGSKSFNLFFMIFHIFGFFGFLIFIILLTIFYLKIFIFYFKKNQIYSVIPLIYMSVFLFMALFSPIHQYPFGMLIVALSIIFYKKGSAYGSN